jgi:hypothetical protein
MLPNGPLARDQLRKLRVFAGSEHSHVAQSPVHHEFTSRNNKNSIRYKIGKIHEPNRMSSKDVEGIVGQIKNLMQEANSKLHSELGNQFQGLQKELGGKFDGLHDDVSKLTNEFNLFRSDMQGFKNEVLQALATQTTKETETAKNTRTEVSLTQEMLDEVKSMNVNLSKFLNKQPR